MEHLIEDDRELDCGDVGALLSGLIDDELPVEVRHAAERHMATCGPCRAAMDRAERTEELMLASFEVAPALPAGFEDAVLARTTRSLPLRFTQQKPRWFAVSGWLAAAAMLALSAVIWTLNSNSGESRGRVVNNETGDGVIQVSLPGVSHYALPPEAVSSTGDARLSKLPMANTGGETSVSSASGIALGIESAQGGAAVNTNRPMFFSGQGQLSQEDQQTLIQVSNLLRMMLEDDGQSFAVAERMRQNIETAELLARVERVRDHVPVQHRAMLMNVESILWKIVIGPVHESDLRVLRQMTESLDLAGELDRLSGNVIPNRSL